jgi:ribosomal protein S18 acetylase RimI-like enzyme
MEDASLIARIGAATFEAAFGADNTPEDMNEYLAANFNLANIQAHLADPLSSYLLGYESGQVFGYAMFRVGEAPEAVGGPNPIELVRFYVDQNFIGQGYGSALMQACIDEATRDGYTPIWLGVWEKNDRAIGFYEKWGFTRVGMKQFVLGTDPQTDVIMERNA